jgi:hypothetical protein
MRSAWWRTTTAAKDRRLGGSARAYADTLFNLARLRAISCATWLELHHEAVQGSRAWAPVRTGPDSQAPCLLRSHGLSPRGSTAASACRRELRRGSSTVNLVPPMAGEDTTRTLPA